MLSCTRQQKTFSGTFPISWLKWSDSRPTEQELHYIPKQQLNYIFHFCKVLGQMLLFYFNLMFWVNTKSFPTQQKGRPVAALFYFNLTPVYEKLLTFVLVALLALSIAIDDCPEIIDTWHKGSTLSILYHGSAAWREAKKARLELSNELGGKI